MHVMLYGSYTGKPAGTPKPTWPATSALTARTSSRRTRSPHTWTRQTRPSGTRPSASPASTWPPPPGPGLAETDGAGPVSAPAPRPAPQEGVLRPAADLGRRHGKAAVYWQIGDSGSDAAQGFYRVLLAGIAGADPEIMSLYQMPGLTAQQDYDRGNLAADLGLARDDPALVAAAEAYLAAAREEFWLEAARLARLRLRPGRDQTAGGAGQLTAKLPGSRQKRYQPPDPLLEFLENL